MAGRTTHIRLPFPHFPMLGNPPFGQNAKLSSRASKRKTASDMGRATTSSRYPIGIQTFEKIREGGYLYVDKTAFVYELAHGSGSTYFLNLPHRFGKSLLLSTMQAYFEGRQDFRCSR